MRIIKQIKDEVSQGCGIGVDSVTIVYKLIVYKFDRLFINYLSIYNSRGYFELFLFLFFLSAINFCILFRGMFLLVLQRSYLTFFSFPL